MHEVTTLWRYINLFIIIIIIIIFCILLLIGLLSFMSFFVCCGMTFTSYDMHLVKRICYVMSPVVGQWWAVRTFLSPQCRNSSRDPDHAHLGNTHSSQD